MARNIRAQSRLSSPPELEREQPSSYEDTVKEMLAALMGKVDAMQGNINTLQGDFAALHASVATLKIEGSRGNTPLNRRNEMRELNFNEGRDELEIVNCNEDFSEEVYSENPSLREQPRHHRGDGRGRRTMNPRYHDRRHQRNIRNEGHGRDHYEEDEFDDPSKNFKHSIPEFHGRFEPEVYLEWETRTEKFFSLHNYAEKDKVRLAIMKFRGHADTWLSDVMRRRKNRREGEERSWAEMTELMRVTFVP